MPSRGRDMGSERGERIRFTLEQQAHIDELIGKAYGKGRRKGKIEIDELKARIAELESKKSIFPWRRK